MNEIKISNIFFTAIICLLFCSQFPTNNECIIYFYQEDHWGESQTSSLTHVLQDIYQ